MRVEKKEDEKKGDLMKGCRRTERDNQVQQNTKEKKHRKKQ